MLADRQGLLARGVSEGLPFFPTARDDLFKRLAAEPEAPDKGLAPEEYELRKALGVVA